MMIGRTWLTGGILLDNHARDGTFAVGTSDEIAESE